ncbi:MAG TPA: UDP-N-acetylmuramoyl-L-alanyl-D-glutamate--2,6-diaminopimelate ligase [Candidatus Saccharimonadales bacterium]|nr:UDP-N-acetylmuramoyl-L-alanyl-D-glutamate--2,6-diaminopimelate ligase [Candidatus Saccharimonadales bacterium]
MNFRSAVKKVIPQELFRYIEPYGHYAEAVLWNIAAGFPARGLKVIGVTGTDGKTTTCTLIAQLLRENGYRVAMITTVSIDLGDGKGPRPNPTRLTTMGARSLVAKMKQVKRAGAEWLILETTSHALAQHRVWSVPYTVVAMTNIGHEHLDYHKTFERYRDAKKRLFTQCDHNRQGLRVGIINADDPSAALFARAIKNPMTYGIKKGELRARAIRLTPEGSQYHATIAEDNYHITCHLPGSFNVYNSLAAIGVGRAVGLSQAQIERGIASLYSVEGRMTRVDEGQDFTVIVDYAHTPESFEKVFKEVRPLTKKRLIAVFGSAGRRDEIKRAQQGEIAGRDCDVVIVTEEDDRDIDGQEIMNQIAAGAEKAGKQRGKDLLLNHERADAVRVAITIARKGDIVLLLGKGHEKSILSNGPQAAELRHIQQDDTDPRRVIKRDYDEVTTARKVLRHKLGKR